MRLIDNTPYYVFDADAFILNYRELENSFRKIYPKYQIGYSFKTNYTPAVCELVQQMGGYAEVVSDMEFQLALKVGFSDNNIIYNGPAKGCLLKHALLNGALLNVDNFSELQTVCHIAREHPERKISIGLRVNFDIGNGLHSRFGIDVTNGDIERVLHIIAEYNNLEVIGLHYHISRARGLSAWKNRIKGVLNISTKYFNDSLRYIDIGSGMFGHLDEELQDQFGVTPSYDEYAEIVAKEMFNHFKEFDDTHKPILITEPGTTLISKYFHLYSKVIDIKDIRGKKFALLDCSFHNVGEICGLKKVPVHIEGTSSNRLLYENIDFVGYTCLEQDVMVKEYTGELGKDDIVEFYNVGGYSIVDKPPFIHPDIPIYMLYKNEISCIKRAQTMYDIFAPYAFENFKKK